MYSLHSELRPGPVLQTVALAAALWAAGCDSNEAPVAMDSIPGQSVAIGETATVSLDQYFRDADGDPLTFDATSGAPAVATASVSGQSLTVTGVSQGTAEVTVTANDAEGLSATQRFTATVPNRAPTVSSQIPDAEVFVGEILQVDLSEHFADMDGDELTYAAASSDEGVAAASLSGAELSVAALRRGNASVTVAATDPGGLRVEQVFAFVVPNRAPAVSSQIPDAELHVGDAVEVDLSGHFADPDGDELLYAAASSDDEVATALVSDSTALIVAGVGQGVATVTVTATDPGGLSVEQSFAVTVPNRGPIVSNPIPDAEAHVGDAVEVELSGHFADPDGDELSYASASSDDEVATATASGASLTVAGVGQGTATVTVTATDPGGLSVEQGFTVTVPNRAPEVSNPIPDAEIHVGETIDVDLSGHFADPDGDDLSYAATSSDEGVATASASGASLTVAAVGQGSASVTVTATDPGGLSVEQSFAVTVPNRRPIVSNPISDAEIHVGDTVKVELSEHFSDPDGDELSYTATSSDEGVVAVSTSGASLTVATVGEGVATVTVTAADPGGLSVSQSFAATVEQPNRAPEPAGEIAPVKIFKGGEFAQDVSHFFTDPDGDELTYAARSSDVDVATVGVAGDVMTVRAVAQGEAEVVVTATDPSGLSAAQTAQVSVENRGPEVVEPIPSQTLKVGWAVTLDVTGNFIDPDGDELSYSAASSDTLLAVATVDGDEVEIEAVGAGDAVVSIAATDPGGLSATLEVEVTILENHPPRAVGELEDHILVTDDTVVVDVADLFTDPDDEELSYAARSSDGMVATAEADGSQVTIAATGGGAATVTVLATDPGGLSDSLSASIGVNPPVVADTLPVHDLFIVVEEGESEADTLSKVVLDVSDYFSDPDGDELTYSASTEHDTVAEVESVNGSVVTTAPVEVDTASLWDSTTVTVTATDPYGLSVSQEAQVRVAHADYGAWDGLEITEEGGVILAGLSFSGCFPLDEFVYGDTVYTVHRSEWQRQEGTGWVQLAETYKELEVCTFEDLPDEPAGVYRLVGEVTTWPSDTADTDEGDTVRALRKSENTIEIEDDAPPPPYASAPGRPSSGVGEPLRSRGLAAVASGRRSRRGAQP